MSNLRVDIEALALEVIVNPLKESKFMNGVNMEFNHIDISDPDTYINAVNEVVSIASEKGYITYNDLCYACNAPSMICGDLFGWKDASRFFYSIRICEDPKTLSYTIILPKAVFIKEEVETVKQRLVMAGAYKRA